MNRSAAYLILLVIVFSITGYSQIEEDYFQKNPEVYFSFRVSAINEINTLTEIISIDNVQGNIVFAYANEDEFSKFLLHGYEYQILTRPGLLGEPVMSSSIEDFLGTWDSYPTYETYVSMMSQFAQNYPSICQLVDAGTTVQGRKILFVKISDNVNVREAEPMFMYSSTMHGDETAGYVLMLRLIDSLLTSYGTDTRITEMINNTEIWINPNANPDGTYRNGNHTVQGATRYNANNIDLNRNFPDPAAGPHPDGNQWQPETVAMMNLAMTNNFIHSANFHGGAEVVNYPWDTWARLHADNNWFVNISRKYADTVHANSSPPYMRGFNNGITNGYAWYRITGGRQDYFTYFAHGREVTIEISNSKLLNASLLPAHWNYNKKSFFDYIDNTKYGFRGIVTDTVGTPVKAFIRVENHDIDNAEIKSDSITGFYHRMISPGTYTVKVSSPDHHTTTISNVVVSANSLTTVDVVLIPINPVPVELTSFTADDAKGKAELRWQTAGELNNHGFFIERNSDCCDNDWLSIGFTEGKGTTTEISDYFFTDNNLVPGKYFYRLKQMDFDGTLRIYGPVEAEIAPIEFYLDQNYPNPFNPSTTITWFSHEESWQTLKIYDVLGREVATLVDEPGSAGKHEIVFNAGSLSGGVYLYKLTAGKHSAVRKFMLLK